jgi:hypothetical protein
MTEFHEGYQVRGKILLDAIRSLVAIGVVAIALVVTQTVFVPLRPGSSTLLLSVDGTTASGQVATDADRLVFLVP